MVAFPNDHRDDSDWKNTGKRRTSHAIFTNGTYAYVMLVYLIFVGGPTFAVVYQAWRAWDFFVWWRPVQATTLSSDYGEAERLSDTGSLPG